MGVGLISSARRRSSAGSLASIKLLGSGTFTGSGTVTYNFSSLLNATGAVPTLQAGDLVLCVLTNGNSGARPQAEEMPSGYTAINSLVNAGNQINFQASYKIMGATPDTSLTTGVGGSLPTFGATVHVFRNVDQTTPIDATATTASGTGTGQADPPSFTPVTSGAWVIAAGGASRSSGSLLANFANPSGFNPALSFFRTVLNSSTIDAASAVAVKADWTSGAVDPPNLSGSTSASAWGATTFAFRPAAGTPTTPGTTTPTIRASRLQYVSNSSSAVYTLPTGSLTGDMCVIAASHGFGVPTPSGWAQIDRIDGTNCNGGAFVKTLTAADITTGSVTIAFAGTYYGTIFGVTFTGLTGGVRTFASSRNSAGAASRTITTDSFPKANDVALRFGFGRFNGTVSLSDGTSLQTSSQLNASGCLNSIVVGSDGAVSSTFNFSASPTGDYQITVIVAPVDGI